MEKIFSTQLYLVFSVVSSPNRSNAIDSSLVILLGALRQMELCLCVVLDWHYIVSKRHVATSK
jgi:hypothetical protein